MLDRQISKEMQREERFYGIADKFKQFTAYPFGGMNNQDSRQGMEDSEFFLLENFIKIGKGNLRTIWDNGAALYDAPAGKTIVSFFWFNIQSTYYCAIFLSDGTADQVDISGNVTHITSVTGTFYSGTQLPACGQWGAQYLIIANNITANSYWIWDGSILYTSGTLGPVETITSGGSGYTSVPTVTVYGGSGTGATVTAGINNGSVTSLTITNPGSGYLTSDIPQLLITGGGSDNGARLTAVLTAGVITSVTVVNGGTGFTFPPTLTVTGGGGSGAVLAAVLTVDVITSVTVTNGGTKYTSVPAIFIQTGVNRAASGTISIMPFGVSGSSLETYQSRVWLPYPNQTNNQANGGTFLVTAPGSLTDFSTVNGGLIFTNSDSFLRAQYTNIKQSNGYLYPFGDSSVSVISNVQTSGSPATTTFNYQNTDPQIGTSWRDSLQAYSRTLLLGNPLGIYGLYGGAVTKVSAKIDDIFTNAVFASPGLIPTSAVANIYNQKVSMTLMTIKDPVTALTRNAMIAWDERQWYIFSQSADLIYIGTRIISSNITAWGTDGASLYQLFSTPSDIPKRIATKLYGQDSFLIQKNAMGIYVQVQNLSYPSDGVVFESMAIETEHGSYPVPNIPEFADASQAYYPVNSIGSGDVFGVNLGLTITSESPDFILSYLSIGYIETASIAMGTNPIAGQVSTE